MRELKKEIAIGQNLGKTSYNGEVLSLYNDVTLIETPVSGYV